MWRVCPLLSCTVASQNGSGSRPDSLGSQECTCALCRPVPERIHSPLVGAMESLASEASNSTCNLRNSHRTTTTLNVSVGQSRCVDLSFHARSSYVFPTESGVRYSSTSYGCQSRLASNGAPGEGRMGSCCSQRMGTRTTLPTQGFWQVQPLLGGRYLCMLPTHPFGAGSYPSLGCHPAQSEGNFRSRPK